MPDSAQHQEPRSPSPPAPAHWDSHVRKQLGACGEEAATLQCHRGQWNTSDLASPTQGQADPSPSPSAAEASGTPLTLPLPLRVRQTPPSPGANRALKWPGEKSCVLSGKLPLLWEGSCVGNSSFTWNYDSVSLSHAAFFYFLGIILKGNIVHIEE